MQPAYAVIPRPRKGRVSPIRESTSMHRMGCHAEWTRNVSRVPPSFLRRQGPRSPSPPGRSRAFFLLFLIRALRVNNGHFDIQQIYIDKATACFLRSSYQTRTNGGCSGPRPIKRGLWLLHVCGSTRLTMSGMQPAYAVGPRPRKGQMSRMSFPRRRKASSPNRDTQPLRTSGQGRQSTQARIPVLAPRPPTIHTAYHSGTQGLKSRDSR